MKCPFSSFSDLFLCSNNCLFKGKDLVEVPMIPPLLGLGNDTSCPLDLKFGERSREFNSTVFCAEPVRPVIYL